MSKTPYTMPPELAYDAGTHMWVRYDPVAGLATVGLDALGQASMGDLAYLVLPAVGAPVRRGGGAGSLEAAKMTGDVVSPLTGTVAAVNAAAMRDPSLVNRDPYGAGWLLQIAPANWSGESVDLISGVAVAPWAAAELARYEREGWIV